MLPLLSKGEMDFMDSGDESDHDPIYTSMLEYIRDKSQYNPNVNRREAHYKIRYYIKQRQSEWKEALKTTQNMGKGLHKVFKSAVKYVLQDLPLWENLVQKFTISFQNLETLLKSQKCQIT